MAGSGAYGILSGEIRPIPRSCTGGNVGASTRQPVARSIRSAACSPAARSPLPLSTSAAEPLRSAAAARSTSPASGGGGAAISGRTGSPSTSAHCMSPGRISVVGPPGNSAARRITSAMSRPIVSGLVAVHTNSDMGAASVWMSAVSGALAAMCHVACSPTIETTGE